MVDNPIIDRYFPNNDASIVNALAVPAVEWLKAHKQITGDDVSEQVWKIAQSVMSNPNRRVTGSVFTHLKRQGLIVEVGTKLSDRLHRNHIPVWQRTGTFENEFIAKRKGLHVVWENNAPADRWE